jgi:hypothetical protein
MMIATVVLVVLLLWFVVFPLLFLAADVLIVVVLAAAGVAIRVLLRRPWIVEAVSDDDPTQRHEWPVVGWRASGQAATGIAEAIDLGHPVDQIDPSQLVPSAPS